MRLSILFIAVVLIVGALSVHAEENPQCLDIRKDSPIISWEVSPAGQSRGSRAVCDFLRTSVSRQQTDLENRALDFSKSKILRVTANVEKVSGRFESQSGPKNYYLFIFSMKVEGIIGQGEGIETRTVANDKGEILCQLKVKRTFLTTVAAAGACL